MLIIFQCDRVHPCNQCKRYDKTCVFPEAENPRRGKKSVLLTPPYYVHASHEPSLLPCLGHRSCWAAAHTSTHSLAACPPIFNGRAACQILACPHRYLCKPSNSTDTYTGTSPKSRSVSPSLNAFWPSMRPKSHSMTSEVPSRRQPTSRRRPTCPTRHRTAPRPRIAVIAAA